MQGSWMEWAKNAPADTMLIGVKGEDLNKWTNERESDDKKSIFTIASIGFLFFNYILG